MLGIGTGLFLFLSALLFFLGVAYDGKQVLVREWFRHRWEAVERSPWRQLPERTIRAIVYPARSVAHYLGSLASESSFAAWAVLLWGIAAPVVAAHLWNVKGAVFISLCTLPGLLVLLDRLGVAPFQLRKRLGRSYTGYQWLKMFSILGIAMWGGVLLDVVRRVIALPMPISAAIMPAALPLTWLLAFLFISNIGVFHITNKAVREDWAVVAGFGVAMSFIVSLWAMYIGHVAVPQAWVPKTLQMLVANALCDSLTLVATLGVLLWAVGDRGLLRIPTAVAMDIGIAASLAVASLHFGLAWTERALSTRGLLNVLIGRSSDGSAWQLGPYFWVMHTAFLPTITYLGLVLVCWLGKTILIPARWFFGISQGHENPLKLTSALCALIAAILEGVARLA